MLKSQIKPGTEYAFREQRAPGTPFQRVRIIQHTRGTKWRAEWVDPSPGLVDYVDSGQLIVPWKEHKAFLKEEADEQRLREYNEAHGYDGEESAVVTALYQVYESIRDGIDFYRGCLRPHPTQ